MGFTAPLLAVEFEFHGDMNNRFLIYTNHQDWLNNEQDGILEDETIEAYYGELKYRFWFEAADDDDNIKGVYAIEVGGIRFGEGADGDFSGDGVDVETRWAYLDLQTPGVDRKMRWRMGLTPWKINSFFWQETATGVKLYGDAGEMVDYEAAWIRPLDKLATDSTDDDLDDLDILYGRLNVDPTDMLNVGLFGLYFHSHEEPAGAAGPRDWLLKQFDNQASFDIWTVGVDGGWDYSNLFFNWDLLYQGGSIDDLNWNPNAQAGDTFIPRTAAGTDFDLSAWFAHADAGIKFGDHKLTYTFWYASGDDDPNDDDFEGYLAVDLDRADNISIFEGLYTDDSSYFTERPYMLDKGFIMNKLGWDYKVSDKMTVGAAGMHMMTAEDIEYTNATGGNESNDEIGFELNGYLKYMLYKNVEFKINAGYLWAGDAMDAFETGAGRDGSSDEDIFGSSFRIRYKF
jgi:hypothetical protein